MYVDKVEEIEARKNRVLQRESERHSARNERIAELQTKESIKHEAQIDEIVDEEISIGDYVLTGGELPALVVTDAVCRMLDGVLSEEVCFTEESHFNGLLEYPHYTRPEVWHGVSVPDVLLSGHHLNIAKWREEKSVEITRKLRPDMLNNK